MFDIIKALLKAYPLVVCWKILLTVKKTIAQLFCYYIVACVGFYFSHFLSFRLLGLALHFHGNIIWQAVMKVYFWIFCKRGLSVAQKKVWVCLKMLFDTCMSSRPGRSNTYSEVTRIAIPPQGGIKQSVPWVLFMAIGFGLIGLLVSGSTEVSSALNICCWIAGLPAGASLFYPPAGGNDIMGSWFSIDLVLTFANMVKVSYSILGRVG